MQIRDDEALSVLNAYMVRMEATSRRSEIRSKRIYPGASDVVEISGLARQLNALSRIVTETPDVDMSRVLDIRNQIQAGSYHIDSARLADRLVRGSVLESLFVQ